jgi:hypothetical protein
MANYLPAWPLVLLDLHDRHEKFDQELEDNIFHRFTDKDQCLRHQRDVAERLRLLYFFIPHSEHEMIGADMVPMTTIFHLYCASHADASAMDRLYNMPMMVKIFIIGDLWIRLKHAALDLYIDRGTRQRHVPDERDLAFQLAADLADQLADGLREHMEVQIGVEATDE